MHFHSERRLESGILERRFTLGEIPGVLWTPASTPAPLILAGHPGGLGPMHPRLSARALDAAVRGFASVAIELPGSGDRPRLEALEQARADLRTTLASGGAPNEAIIDALVLPLVDLAVPEWQATLDAVLQLPDVEGPVGFSGGVIAIAVRLAVLEPRIVAALLFAGSFVPLETLAEARRVTVPVHVLLQWDDEWNDRRRSLELFDALGSAEKTLHANTGGHTGVPAFEADASTQFFVRHLRQVAGGTGVARRETLRPGYGRGGDRAIGSP